MIARNEFSCSSQSFCPTIFLEPWRRNSDREEVLVASETVFEVRGTSRGEACASKREK